MMHTLRFPTAVMILRLRRRYPIISSRGQQTARSVFSARFSTNLDRLTFGKEVNQTESIRAELQRIWKRKVVACAAFLGIFPIGALAFSFLPETPFRIVCIGYWVLIMGLALRLNSSICPTCGKAFHCRSLSSGSSVRSGLTMSCLNCGQSLEGRNNATAILPATPNTEQAGASDGDKPPC